MRAWLVLFRWMGGSERHWRWDDGTKAGGVERKINRTPTEKEEMGDAVSSELDVKSFRQNALC